MVSTLLSLHLFAACRISVLPVLRYSVSHRRFTSDHRKVGTLIEFRESFSQHWVPLPIDRPSSSTSTSFSNTVPL